MRLLALGYQDADFQPHYCIRTPSFISSSFLPFSSLPPVLRVSSSPPVSIGLPESPVTAGVPSMFHAHGRDSQPSFASCETPGSGIGSLYYSTRGATTVLFDPHFSLPWRIILRIRNILFPVPPFPSAHLSLASPNHTSLSFWADFLLLCKRVLTSQR